MPGQTDIRARASSREPPRSSTANVRDWYAGGLQPKLARAVAEGRVDAGQAAELHWLMTRLLEPEEPLRR